MQFQKFRSANVASLAVNNMQSREGPIRRPWYLFAITAIALMFGFTVPPVSVRGDDDGGRNGDDDGGRNRHKENSRVVRVTVDASDAFGNELSYQWRATDGHIVNQNARTTYWTLPKGPGIHFAYVLVSNGKGG